MENSYQNDYEENFDKKWVIMEFSSQNKSETA